MDRPPIERMRKFKNNVPLNDEDEYRDGELQNLRAKRVKSKRSHKLGLTKDYDNDPNLSPQKLQNQKSYEKLDVGSYTDTSIGNIDKGNNRTIDYGDHIIPKHIKSITSNQTPDKMYSKRENRLREFYVRSQRKDANGSNFASDSKDNRHFKSTNSPFQKPADAAMTMMDISAQLDRRNIDKHKGRNLFLDKASDSFNHSDAISKFQASSTKLPRVNKSVDINPNNHSRVASNMDTANKMMEKEITKGNFFNISPNEFIAAKLSVNPITGQLSPVMQKPKVF